MSFNQFFKRNIQRNIRIQSINLHSDLIPLLQFQNFRNFSNKRTFPSGVINHIKMSKERSEEEWRAILSPEQFRIIRQKETENLGSGEYNKFNGKGK